MPARTLVDSAWGHAATQDAIKARLESVGALPNSPAKNKNGSNGANGGSAGGSELLSNLNKVGTGVSLGLNSYLQVRLTPLTSEP